MHRGRSLKSVPTPQAERDSRDRAGLAGAEWQSGAGKPPGTAGKSWRRPGGGQRREQVKVTLQCWAGVLGEGWVAVEGVYI